MALTTRATISVITSLAAASAVGSRCKSERVVRGWGRWCAGVCACVRFVTAIGCGGEGGVDGAQVARVDAAPVHLLCQQLAVDVRPDVGRPEVEQDARAAPVMSLSPRPVGQRLAQVCDEGGNDFAREPARRLDHLAKLNSALTCACRGVCGDGYLCVVLSSAAQAPATEGVAGEGYRVLLHQLGSQQPVQVATPNATLTPQHMWAVSTQLTRARRLKELLRFAYLALGTSAGNTCVPHTSAH